MASKRPVGGGQGGQGTGGAGGAGSSGKAAQSATHVYASSLAVPVQSQLAHLESKLTSLSQRISPFLQRDVILSRIDDTDPYRIELETNDSSFAPMQRARQSSRLHVRFERGKIEMRVYSQGQGGGANKSSDLVNIRSLVIAEIYTGQDKDDEEKEQYGVETLKKRQNQSANPLPREVNAGGDHWHQLTLAMGWVPHHTVVRSGHCFTIRQDKTMTIQVYLFHLLKLNEEANPVTLGLVANTRVLQAVVTMPLSTKPDRASADVANLSDRAHGEMVKLQEALRGLVDLSKDVD